MKLSIVMPAHNEAANIDRSILEWYETVVAKVPASELVVVDDCSTDDTPGRLDALKATLPALRVLRTASNVGHGPAVRLGLDSCRGEFVFQTDSDRQHAPDDFWLLWNARDDVDFVLGVRTSRADGPFRAMVSGGLRLMTLLVWGCWIADANCPFKLMRKNALRAVLDYVPADAFLQMVMVAVLARRGGFRVCDVRVRHFPRTSGPHSLAGARRWIDVGRRCIGELMALRAGMSGGRLAELRRAANSLNNGSRPGPPYLQT